MHSAWASKPAILLSLRIFDIRLMGRKKQTYYFATGKSRVVARDEGI